MPTRSETDFARLRRFAVELGKALLWAREHEVRIFVDGRQMTVNHAPFSIEEVTRVRKALSDYVVGRKETLDDAFGVKRNRGERDHPPPTCEIRKIAIRGNRMRANGATWPEIAEVWPHRDPSDIARICERHLDYYIKAEGRRLAAKPWPKKKVRTPNS